MAVPGEIAAGRRRREILANAALSNHPLFSSIPPDVLARLVKTQRLTNRLYRKVIDEFGAIPPANRLVEAFLLTSENEIKETAKILGVTLSLPSLRTHLTRSDIDALGRNFHKSSMKKILTYANITVEVPIRNYNDLEECFAHMEADGWVMMEIWARHNRIDPRWRIRPGATENSGIASIPGSQAITLVNQAMLDLVDREAEV
ncbi:hypothetical protein [Rhizobium rhizoryzae]|jgi:hypothetical protein|uniref:hypothetical protein n=1 Tax=Rhizobium rhizoryzae TaxID=451876 RepID=UPI0028A25870|nr:hypothetical protein [Rhizobium rhizoryzae]